MKGKERYSEIFRKRASLKVRPVFLPSDPNEFKERHKLSGRVMDFGCGIDSPAYRKALRDGGRYSGFDLDKEAAAWLQEMGLYSDFWETGETFDLIVASQVYEHLDHSERERFLERCRKLLRPGGLLLLDFPYVRNLGGLDYWADRTHSFPPEPIDDAHLAELYGFEAEVYLVGISYYPLHQVVRFLLNLLLGFHPQHTALLVLRGGSKE